MILAPFKLLSKCIIHQGEQSSDVLHLSFILHLLAGICLKRTFPYHLFSYPMYSLYRKDLPESMSLLIFWWVGLASQTVNKRFKGITIKLNVIWLEVKSLSCVQLFVTPWTVAYEAPPSMGFSRQEYWSGVPFPSPGDLSNPGIEPKSPTLQADALPSELPRKLWFGLVQC